MTRRNKEEDAQRAELEKAIAESCKPDGRLDVPALFFHPAVLGRTMAWLEEQRAELAKQRVIKEVRLVAREQELLEANTRFAEERRAVNLHAMVAQFHRTGGYPVRHSPAVPSDDEIRFRFRLIAEEFFEQFDACFPGALQRQLIADAKDRVRQLIEIGPIGKVDLEALVDAWADLKYVIVGSEVTFGVDGNAVFRVVHAANLRKFGPGARRDANDKPVKPPGWTPPDIAGELERQRHEETRRT
jgi:predicted HAD superfamily Cof-like phosphohydrolase